MDIKELAIIECRKSYQLEYFDSIDQDRKITLGLSKMLSRNLDFDGVSILEACQAALTDCNYHSEARKVQEIIDKLNGDS